MTFDPQSLFRDDIIPPCSKLLGASLIDVDLDAGWVKLGFVPKPEFTNPRGGIQGGFITAMLDELFSFAVYATYEGKCATPTIELSTQFLRTVNVEPLTGIGRIVKAGSKVVFTEAELFDAQGRLCAKATASTMLIPLKPTTDS